MYICIYDIYIYTCIYIVINVYMYAHTGYTGTKPPRRSQGELNGQENHGCEQ